MRETMTMSALIRVLCLLVSAMLVARPAAAEVQAQGQVGSYTVGAFAGSYDFRIFLATGGVVCNGYNWAYINTTDANYQALVAVVLSAKALGQTVILGVNVDGGTGYCHLQDITAW